MTTRSKRVKGLYPPHKSVQDAVAAEDLEGVIKHLTVRQRRFAEEYVIDFDGKAAAIRAGYAPTYADRQAYQLLHHSGVSFYIDSLSRTKEARITAICPDYIIQEVLTVVHKDGVKDNDKLKALDLLARHLGMFVTKTEISGKDGGAIEIEQRKITEASEDFILDLQRLSNRAKKDVAVI